METVKSTIADFQETQRLSQPSPPSSIERIDHSHEWKRKKASLYKKERL